MNMAHGVVAISELLQEARRCLLARRFDESESVCRRVLKLNKRHIDAMHLLALSRLEQGDHARALGQLAEALKIDPQSAELHLSRGNALSAAGRHLEALSAYARSARIHPMLVEAHYNQGVALADLGRHAEALDCYRQALQLRPQNADAWFACGNTLLALGRIDDAVQAYTQSLQIRPGSVDAHSNLGAAFQHLRRFDEALAQYELTLRLQPAHAMALGNLSMVLVELGRMNDALQTTEFSLRQDENRATAWHQRGRVLSRLGRNDEAVLSYWRAAALAPDDDAIHFDLAIALALQGRKGDVLGVFEERLRLRPDDPGTLVTLGFSLTLLGQFAQARASYERAREVRPEKAETAFHLGCLDLLEGDWLKGWVGYESRWDDPGTRLRRRQFAVPAWDGAQDLHGRTLLVHAEQGFGDTVQFCRFLPLLARRGAHIVFEVAAPLHGLLRGNLPQEIVVLKSGEALPAFDLHLPLLSAAKAFATTPATVPNPGGYLRARADRIEVWAGRLGAARSLRVGVAWSGNPAHIHDARRSIPLALMQGLLAEPVEFVSLQTEVRESDRDALALAPGIRHFGNAVVDFDDTAALLSLCDLVVSVDSSVAHLAGALGKPVWVLLPWVPDWRWQLGRQDSPWYASARLFRQPRADDWNAVLEDVLRGLDDLRRRSAGSPVAMAS
jgi:tetratricopeptide (TPR) repeat protein